MAISGEFAADILQDPEYEDQLRAVLHKKRQRIIFNLDTIRQKGNELPNRIIERPTDFYPQFRDQIRAYIDHLYSGENPLEIAKPEGDIPFGFEGSFGRRSCTPRGLTSSYIGNMVMVDGIVTKVSLPHPKAALTTHYCETTNKVFYREYRDMLSLNGPPTGTTYPTMDDKGNPITTEFGLSIFEDQQFITIQEMPERAPPGQLPRSIDVVLMNDLIDCVKAGDRVRVVGIYKAVGNGFGVQPTTTFKTLIIANNVMTKQALATTAIPSSDEFACIRQLRQRLSDKDLFTLLSRSIAPFIYGHQDVKKAVLLMLIGGEEKFVEGKTHLRGDINLLLVGDPSTAKSQILRFVASVAPVSVVTSGRGSSGVGLTAAVVTDQETKERRLEAGAMVLADRGVVCIDEFDKMSESDRVAMHEVMEQQTVTIQKGGIHAQMNARCSVIAAANPIFGQYDDTRSVQMNVGLPDSLISRFDLLFVILDIPAPDTDRSLAKHVLMLNSKRETRQDIRAPRVRDDDDGINRTLDSSSSTTFSSVSKTNVMDDLTNQIMGIQNASLQDDGLALASGISKQKRTGKKARTEETATVYQSIDETITQLQAELVQSGETVTGNRKEETAFFEQTISSRDQTNIQVLSVPFLRKYIHLAKNIHPSLSDSVCDYITQQYVSIRSERNRRTAVPVTARTLETLIRLATAHAKLRFSGTVDEIDGLAAISLLRPTLGLDPLDSDESESTNQQKTSGRTPSTNRALRTPSRTGATPTQRGGRRLITPARVDAEQNQMIDINSNNA
ncbi:putative DNA replication licensing factor MCM3 [Blattamonas nauphoetae]|uniref:DNA replication licensing factor MCM3 n=1 Tax=Blattamonas nauphoetae TaxID=2049346 RepID=A0ABQ9XTG1_9EUKA|nr:putative DNA replication licensing factor MCM3 [Blattamonas nauphoetae]